MNSLVLTGAHIAEQVKLVQPHKVAVAYLGASWPDYLPSVATLDVVVIAPVLGTNPWAVQDLIECLSTEGQDGWEKVFFLDSLHAKLYLGERSAVWGSANLSSNGLSGERLLELCTMTDAPEVLQELNWFFESTLALAKAQYRTVNDRMRRLALLQEETARNPSFDTRYAPARATNFQDFKLLSPDQFYICWYTLERPEMTYGEEVPENHKTVFDDFGHFHPTDGIESGKWVLFWELPDDLSSSKLQAHWMMVDEVFQDAVKTSAPYAYTTVAFQRAGLSRKRMRKRPFSLTPEVRELLRQALMDPKLAHDLIQQDALDDQQNFSLQRSQKALPSLIQKMKELLR
jgi:hypothetical protein